MKTAQKPRVAVADYLNTQIELIKNEKSQLDIAREAGFNKANIITMLKKGSTKLPVSKVGTMAQALRVDPMYLFELVMSEYEPETWAVIQKLFKGQPVLTENEMGLLDVIRASGRINPKIRSDGDRERLKNVILSLQSDNGMTDTETAEETEARNKGNKAKKEATNVH